jgi:hypothetical protein
MSDTYRLCGWNKSEARILGTTPDGTRLVITYRVSPSSPWMAMATQKGSLVRTTSKHADKAITHYVNDSANVDYVREQRAMETEGQVLRMTTHKTAMDAFDRARELRLKIKQEQGVFDGLWEQYTALGRAIEASKAHKIELQRDFDEAISECSVLK